MEQYHVIYRCLIAVLLTLSVTTSFSGDEERIGVSEDILLLPEDEQLIIVTEDYVSDYDEGYSGSGDGSGSGDESSSGENDISGDFFRISGENEDNFSGFQSGDEMSTTTLGPTTSQLFSSPTPIIESTTTSTTTSMSLSTITDTLESTTSLQELISTTDSPQLVDLDNPHCSNFTFGCCLNSTLPAHSLSGQGCCLNSSKGCCPDFEMTISSGQECHCSQTRKGCCKDGLNYASLGCGCIESDFGCCPDQYTAASGPNYEGCACTTFQYGCCNDGITPNDGDKSCQSTGKSCITSDFGCCDDGLSHAKGKNMEGCSCETSEFGCCPDGKNPARGENFEECQNKPADICHMTKDSGACRNYNITRQWYFNMAYGGCSRFWFGGCGGNGNRFEDRNSCESICINPSGTVKCYLPKVSGPPSCTSKQPHYYFDSNTKECREFIYNGCLGNANRFTTQASCEVECMKALKKSGDQDPCKQPVEPGPCNGYFPRWYYDFLRGTCSEFVYGGCKGNANQFETKESCQNSCKHKEMSLKIQKQCRKPRLVPTDGRDCHDSNSVVAKWYFDDNTHSCTPFYLSKTDHLKCGSIMVEENANDTIFHSLEECMSICPNTYAPVISITSHVVIVKEEHTAVLQVQITSNPSPTIIWEFNGTLINSNDPRVSIDTPGTIKINPARTSDTGKWIVSATNGIGIGSKEEINLTVNPTEAPIEVTIQHEGESPYEIGSTIMLRCVVTGFPKPQVNWFKNNARLPHVGRVRWSKDTNELSIDNANLIDNGYYTCRAWNFRESSHDSRNVKVKKADNKTQCVDKPWLARCQLIVQGKFCLKNPMYFQICCNSCTAAGQIYNP